MINNEFVPKELSISDKYGRLYTFLFKPPTPFRLLSQEDKTQARWVENNHHGLRYGDGHISLSEINKILYKFINCKNQVFFVKGWIKKRLFRNTYLIILKLLI